MKRIVALLTAGSLCAAGCADEAPKANPKFTEPPKAQIGQIDAGGGTQQVAPATGTGGKPK